MPSLQIRLDEDTLGLLRGMAAGQGASMAMVIKGLIRNAAGTPPAPVSPAGAPAIEAPSSGEVLAELKTQTALLQALVSQAAATPHGGTEPRRVVITEPEVMAGGLMSAADFASPPAPSVPDGYCPAEEAGMAELAQGTEVWVNRLGCTGTVKSPPTQGVYLIQPADRSLGAQHLHIRDLSIRNA